MTIADGVCTLLVDASTVPSGGLVSFDLVADRTGPFPHVDRAPLKALDDLLPREVAAQGGAGGGWSPGTGPSGRR